MRKVRSRLRSYGTGGGWVQRIAALVVTLACLAPALASAAGKPLKIVALGDSLTAGLGLPGQDAFPVKLQAALKARGYDVTVVNAGVSGDTAAAGLERLEWSVPEDADAAIVELGANDALRGLEPAQTEQALSTILDRFAGKHVPVLLAGMLAPRNMGLDYTAKFDRIYPMLAANHPIVFYPFFLEGVAADPHLNQGDGLHPTAAGVDVIVQRILPKVEELIARAKAQPR